MNTMEFESIEFLTNYNYFSSVDQTFFQSHEFSECRQANSCSSLSENSSQNSIQEGSFLEYDDQNLLDQFDPISYNPEDFLTISPVDPQNIEELSNSRHVEEEDEEEEEEEEEENKSNNNIFKGIQAELMEEESLTDLLLAAAEAIEAQNHLLVSNLIEKLKNLLLYDMGSYSFNQLAWFFTQGLHYKTLDYNILAADYQIKISNNSMSAFQMLQQLSPYIKFAHFTANQAILEAAEGEKLIHIIDFDIMEGIQWPPLMADLAAKKEVCSLRLTAIVQDNESERKIIEQTGRRLSEFAKSINFPFIFDQMGIEKEDSFEGIQVLGETVIANCSGIFHHILSYKNLSKLETFLDGVSKLSPKCVVLVEEELFKVTKELGPQPMSFVEFFFEAFHHFSALSDSFLRCFSGVYENGFKQVMEEFLGTRILESVTQFPCDKKYVWKSAFDHLKGYKKIPFSSFNCSQAKYLISLFRGDFWVQHEKCSLSLCWKSRPLCTATIWVPKSGKLKSFY